MKTKFSVAKKFVLLTVHFYLDLYETVFDLLVLKHRQHGEYSAVPKISAQEFFHQLKHAKETIVLLSFYKNLECIIPHYTFAEKKKKNFDKYIHG